LKRASAAANAGKSSFAARLIRWHKSHGRHDLPWQGTTDPYRIWISEIMLQQTQVSAVIPYFTRFMAAFPDIASLARASSDAVMQRWSGLGYYSRARNLHQAAKIMAGDWRGSFPPTAADINNLPGIGRSTAAAIAAFAFGERGAILDGNVKRVLCRFFGVAGYPGEKKVENQLWELASSLLPKTGIEIYTQAMMDLGATLCTRGKPACGRCPLAEDCVAFRDGLTTKLPTPRPKKTVPRRGSAMLILMRENRILLELRPPSGIWGGLWSLPEAASDADWIAVCKNRFGATVKKPAALAPLTHGFTHFTLDIQPVLCPVVGTPTTLGEPGQRWLGRDEIAEVGLPAPVKRLLLEIVPKTS
jgi:A/G-specific adenine glycosylase